MISKELEAGCFLIYFYGIGESGDLSLLWQHLQGNGDSASSDRPVVTLRPHSAQRYDSHSLSQESRSSLVTGEQEFLSITEPIVISITAPVR